MRIFALCGGVWGLPLPFKNRFPSRPTAESTEGLRVYHAEAGLAMNSICNALY
jgi:hypothetical protein